MDIAILVCLLVFGGLSVVQWIYVEAQLKKKLDVAAFRVETIAMGEKELAGFRKACNDIQVEWESVYTKFVRLYSRTTKQLQEDAGTAKGGPNSRAANLEGGPPYSRALTRAEINRMIALGQKVPREKTEWPTGSQQEPEASSAG